MVTPAPTPPPLDPGQVARLGEALDVAILDAIKTVRQQAAEERAALYEAGEPLTDYGSGLLDGLDKAWIAGTKAARRPVDERTVTSPEEWWAYQDAYEAGVDSILHERGHPMTARGEPLAGLEAVLAAHTLRRSTRDCFPPEPWRCACGDEYLSGWTAEIDHRTHVADAVRAHLAATLAGAREDVARAIRDAFGSRRRDWTPEADAALSVIAARLGIEGEA